MMSRKMSRRRLMQMTAGLAGLAGVATLVGCGDDGVAGETATGGSGSGPTRGGTLQVAQSAGPQNLNHQDSLAYPVHGVSGIYAQTLLRFARRGGPLETEVTGYLASAWEQPDPQAMTLTLQDGVRWHDIAPVSGRTLVAEDVKLTLERVLDPDIKSPLAGLLRDFVDKIETPNDREIVIRFKTPFSAMQYTLASDFLWVLPREGAVGDYDLGQTGIGTGPFVLKQVDPGTRYEYVKNEKYWVDGQPYVDKVVLNIITDNVRYLTALTSGDIAWGMVAHRDLDTFKARNKDAVIETFPANRRRELVLVPRKENRPLDDLRVRQAIKYCIDQDEIIDKVYQGAAQFSGIISPASPKWALSEEENRKLWGRNIGEARKLLEAAGYGDGLDVDISFTPQHGAVMADIAEVLTAQMAEAGIRLRIKQLEYTEFVNNLYKWNHQGIAFTPNSANVGADPHDWLYKAFSVNGLYNFSQGPANGGWADDELQRLVVEQYRTFDEQERADIAAQAQRRLAELATNIPTPIDEIHIVQQAALRGYEAHANALNDNNFKVLGQVWVDR